VGVGGWCTIISAAPAGRFPRRASGNKGRDSDSGERPFQLRLPGGQS
jgi:hypothetical protein